MAALIRGRVVTICANIESSGLVVAMAPTLMSAGVFLTLILLAAEAMNKVCGKMDDSDDEYQGEESTSLIGRNMNPWL